MDVKIPTTRRMSNAGSTNVSVQLRAEPKPHVQPKPSIEYRELPQDNNLQVEATSTLVSDFASPPPRTMALLSDPRLSSILTAASETLAPNGVTQDPTDRYAASVIETHLVARRQLIKHTNSLLKT